MKEWTYENYLNKEQKRICRILEYSFHNYGVDDVNGEVVIGKIYDNEEIEFLTDSQFKWLSKELFQQKGIHINYKKNIKICTSQHHIYQKNKLFYFPKVIEK